MVTSRCIKMISVLVLLTLTVSTAAPDLQDIHRLGYKEMLRYGELNKRLPLFSNM